jgi:hypothetical protein
MRPPALPLSYLPSWAKFNDISFEDISVERNTDYGGYGVVTTTTVFDSAGNEDSCLSLLKVPKDLILSAESIAEHSKVDKHYKQILELVGGNVFMLPINHVEHITDSNTVITWRCNVISADASYKSFIRSREQY